MDIEYTKDRPLRLFEAFAGIGFQCQALDRLVKKYPPFSYELVGWSEIDKYVIQMHNILYPQYADRCFGDIKSIQWDKVPDFDLLTWSSPCQDISLAGLQLGLAENSGTRSSLIWNVKEAILAKRPKYIVLENVKNLVGSRYRPYFDHWLELLKGYGYKNFWKVINAADCGVPQSRERVFGVSILRTEDNPDPQFFFPRPIPLTECMFDRLDPKDTVDEKYWLSEKAIEYYERVDADKSHNHNFTRKKKTDIAFTIRCKPGTRVDDNYIIDYDEPKSSD